MNVFFSVQASELDNHFITNIKTFFKKSRLSIAISDDDDETQYLLSSVANRKSLEQAFASKEGYRFTPKEFKKLSDKLLGSKKPDFSKLKKVRLSA